MSKAFSYGKFLLSNPNATKKQRREAVKKFYDFITHNKEEKMKNNQIDKKRLKT
jgi:hypothetical protein